MAVTRVNISATVPAGKTAAPAVNTHDIASLHNSASIMDITFHEYQSFAGISLYQCLTLGLNSQPLGS